MEEERGFRVKRGSEKERDGEANRKDIERKKKWQPDCLQFTNIEYKQSRGSGLERTQDQENSRRPDMEVG